MFEGAAAVALGMMGTTDGSGVGAIALKFFSDVADIGIVDHSSKNRATVVRVLIKGDYLPATIAFGGIQLLYKCIT